MAESAMVARIARFIVVLITAVFVSPLTWAQYRCVENGKTIITDRPCAGDVAPSAPTGNAPKVIGDPGNAAYSTLDGDWRGQVQFQASMQGRPIPDAHAVIPTVLSIDRRGKVTGSSPENGCKLVGIAAPGMMPTVIGLDITLSGCNYQDFNRRLSGTLSLYPAQKYAQLWVYAFPVDLLRPGRTFDIKGTLRR